MSVVDHVDILRVANNNLAPSQTANNNNMAHWVTGYILKTQPILQICVTV